MKSDKYEVKMAVKVSNTNYLSLIYCEPKRHPLSICYDFVRKTHFLCVKF